MKMIRLVLNNFKGIHWFVLDLMGQNATIFGDNATGKTTLYDAFLWLMFGKDSQGRKDFSVKPTQSPSGVEVSVSCEFELEDGSSVSLKKLLKENWVKQRGWLDAIYSGDVTVCYIDEVPKKVTEFTAYIKDLCDETVFKLLTNPLYFNEQIKWQDRRTMLFDVCGDVSEADVITSTEDLKDLPLLMRQHTVEDFKKILAERRKLINKELELLPVRIDEAAKTIVEVDVPAAKAKIAELEPILNQLESELHRSQSGDDLKSLRSKLSSEKEILLNLQMQNNRYLGEQEYAAKKVYQENFDQLVAERRKAEQGMNDADNQIFRHKKYMKELTARLESARGEYSSVKSKVWNGSNICPTCQQQLPQEQIDASFKRFNDDQSEKMMCFKGIGESLQAERTALAAEIECLSKQSTQYSAERERINSEIALLDKPVVSVKDMPEFAKQYSELQSATYALRQEIDSKNMNLQTEVDLLSERIGALRTQLSEAVKVTLIDQQNHDAQARIVQYEHQQKDYAVQFDENEKAIYLCELFVRRKTAMVTERINSKFKLARFKLFDQQVNGGIAECCEVMVDEVTYSNLNNAMRINVGLDIISTLQQHYSFTSPVFIDNAESITNLYKLNSQMIQLVVSASDKQLKLVTNYE